jgi:hypothetical protein
MKYRNGDKVRIITKNTTHTDETGVVVNAYTDNESLLVRLDISGQDIGFFKSEVEMVWTEEELEHINGIAGSLINEDRNVQWDWKTAFDTAVALYRVGVRYNV